MRIVLNTENCCYFQAGANNYTIWSIIIHWWVAVTGRQENIEAAVIQINRRERLLLSIPSVY